MARYRELVNNMIEKIHSGKWENNQLLPTEAELCKEYNTSRITVRRALFELENMNFVKKAQGRGTIVTHKGIVSGNLKEGFSEHLRGQGIIIKSKVIKNEIVEPSAEVRKKLQLSDDEKYVYHIVRLRTNNDICMSLMNTYFSLEIGEKVNKYELNDASFYHIYSEIFGTPITKTVARITAIIPDDETCHLIKEKPGSAELWFKSVGYIGNHPIEAVEAIFNAKYYEFNVEGMGNLNLKGYE